jgi:hypothetical protein
MATLAGRSAIVVLGTVTKVAASEEPTLAPTNATVVIKIERMFAGSEFAGDQTGRTATIIVCKPGHMKVGTKALFFGNPRFIGKTITMADVGEFLAPPTDERGTQALSSALQTQRDSPVRERLDIAQMVFRGTVESVRPLEAESSDKRPRLRSEHDPEWHVAMVHVTSSVRGTQNIGAAPFAALTDPSDSVAGRFVTNALTLASGLMGQNRLGASNVSIAVDPCNSDRVYVAWGDSNGANSETIHVRRSINRGVDWSDDLLTVTSAINPEVAIDDIGIVGVLYQSVVGGKWETRVARSNDMDATTFTMPGILLASQSATTPTVTFWPYIGDYASLVAVGTNFVGMFSASNYPDKANFMTGVTFQREADWTAHKLYADAAHTVDVAPSIDPFFFEIKTSICDKTPNFCDICKLRPELCYPIYDPWWWRKCPMCQFEIFIHLEDDYRQVTLFDSLGEKVGKFQRLREPVVEKGVTYNYGIGFKPKEGVGYVLKAELAAGKKLKGNFKPAYAVKKVESPAATR